MQRLATSGRGQPGGKPTADRNEVEIDVSSAQLLYGSSERARGASATRRLLVGSHREDASPQRKAVEIAALPRSAARRKESIVTVGLRCLAAVVVWWGVRRRLMCVGELREVILGHGGASEEHALPGPSIQRLRWLHVRVAARQIQDIAPGSQLLHLEAHDDLVPDQAAFDCPKRILYALRNHPHTRFV